MTRGEITVAIKYNAKSFLLKFWELNLILGSDNKNLLVAADELRNSE